MQDTIAESLDAAFFEDYDDTEIEETSAEVALVETQTNQLAVQTQEAMQAKEDKFAEAQEYVNNNMRNIIELGMGGLNDIMDVMTDSQDPKMYNACASYIKTLVDANKSFLENNKHGVPSLAQGGGKSIQKENQQAQTPQTQVNLQVNGEVKMLSPHELLSKGNEDS